MAFRIDVAKSNDSYWSGTLCNDVVLRAYQGANRIVFGTQNNTGFTLSNNVAVFSTLQAQVLNVATVNVAGDPVVKTWSNNNSVVFLTGSNVAIGKVTASYPLDVQGTINATSFRENNVVLQDLFLASSTSNQIIAISNVAYNTSNALNAQVIWTSNSLSNFVPTIGGTISGNLVVGGNLTVSGTTTTVNTQNLVIQDNLLTINANQTGTPLSTLVSGIEVNRGNLSNYYFMFEEATGLFKIGASNNLQAVMTRDDGLQTGYVHYDASTAKATNRQIVQSDVSGLTASLIFSSNTSIAASNNVFNSSNVLFQDLRTLSNVVLRNTGGGISGDLNLVGQASFVGRNDGSNTPSFTWSNDNSTGMFRPTACQISFALGGVESLSIRSNVVTIPTMIQTGQIILDKGSSTTPSISWQSASNTGMFLFNSNEIGFSTNGSNRIVITSNGQIGIGRYPNYMLDVGGTLNASNILINGERVNAGISSQWSNVSCNVYILSSNVGIGTNNPQSTFHVVGDTKLMGNIELASPLMLSGLTLYAQDETVPVGISAPTQWNTTATSMYVFDKSVGIGTDAPNATLQVLGSLNATTLSENGVPISPQINWTSNMTSNFMQKTGKQSNNLIMDTGTSIQAASGSSSNNIGYCWDGYPFTGMYLHGSNQIGFATAYNMTMLLNSNGNVGIGTTFPASTLDVSGGVRATGAINITGLGQSNATALSIGQSTSNGIFAPTNNRLALATNGGTRMTILENGNVGIGTNNPTYLLDVNGSTRFASDIYVGNPNTSTSVPIDVARIYFGGTVGDVAYNHTFIVNRLYGAPESSELLLFKGNDARSSTGPDRIRLRAGEIVFDTYPTDLSIDSQSHSLSNIRVTITATGQVGIGTRTPDSSLVVIGTTKTDTLQIQNLGQSNATALSIGVSASNGLFAPANNRLAIATNGVSRLTLNEIGDIILSSGSCIEAANDTSNAPSFSWAANSNTGMYREGPNQIGFSVSGSNIMLLNSNGYVGIGTMNPSDTFHVNGNVIASDVIIPSDCNLKYDINPINNALSKLTNIHGYTYKLYQDPKSLTQSGFIAQEVEKVIPSLVNDNGGTKMVSYHQVIPYVVEAVKELQSQMKVVCNKLFTLEKTIYDFFPEKNM